MGWLYTEGNRLLLSSGEVWRGRGANLHDTRSCDACTYAPPNVNEVKRRIDTLVDVWNANFIRLNLESYASPYHENVNVPRVQWQGILDDPQYLAHVKEIVDYIGTKPGVYVLLSLWEDPTFSSLGWPTGQTIPIWRKLAKTFKNTPHVLFGLCNEPQSNDDGARDAQVWTAMNNTVAAIRAVEDEAGTPRHIITVQGTRNWGRWLDYYLTHPITAGGGQNIAYETHAYEPAIGFSQLFELPARTLPIIIGEFGPDQGMTEQDGERLMDRAEALDIPYLAWTFHMRCSPDLLVDFTDNACGVGMPLVPTSWGQRIKDRFALPWCAAGCTPTSPLVHVYEDDLGSRFEDWSWAEHSLGETGVVHAGSKSIRFEPDEWNALHFHHVGLSLSQFQSIELWVHGGTAGGQQVKLSLSDGSLELGSVQLDVALGHPILAGTWQKVSIPFSSLGLSSGTLRGIELMDTSGVDQGAMYVDDLVLVPR
ncbi:glycoside hydrolase family 5 protein [Archangium sp.]|uniref:glycoside hydrolase family 5 protein n=1 Tax=Archangium sp. TaxID=1872627 RepID=UPI002D729D18|nr:cellulase family glycosylhydrolase [Archangium sp.]HYO56721.1 cellulase family glycosylhydrolase [Archangium sp.]